MIKKYQRHRSLPFLWISVSFFAVLCLLLPLASTASQNKPAETTPQRVISLYGGLTENPFALGLGSRIVGVDNSDDYPPEVLSNPRVGTHINPNIEKILALEPNLVLAKNRRGRTAETLTYLEKVGISIFTTAPHTIDDFFTLLKTLGEKFSCQDKAAMLIKEYKIEGLLDKQPDIYIVQRGPMNCSPMHTIFIKSA